MDQLYTQLFRGHVSVGAYPSWGLEEIFKLQNVNAEPESSEISIPNPTRIGLPELDGVTSTSAGDKFPMSSTVWPSSVSASANPAVRYASGPIRQPRRRLPQSIGAPIKMQCLCVMAQVWRNQGLGLTDQIAQYG